MVIAILTILGSILALVPVILNARKNIQANRNALGRVESAELKKGMDDIDTVYAATPDDPPRV